jgi:hypothetical protein
VSTALDDLVAQLEQAAARLRSEHLSADEAADLVDACARLAAEATAELERAARAGDAAAPGAVPLFEPGGGEQP